MCIALCMQRPASVINIPIVLLGTGAAILAFMQISKSSISNATAMLIVLGAYIGTVLLLETLYKWHEGAGALASEKRTPHAYRYDIATIQRLILKTIGVIWSYGFIAFLYWMFEEYHGNFYTPFWEFLKTLAPYGMALTVPYIMLTDRRMEKPEDGYYQLGSLMVIRWENLDRTVIVQHLLGWVVKGFFLPLMFISLQGNIGYLRHHAPIAHAFNDFPTFFRVAKDILFTIDLLAAVAGYLCTFRLFDTHIRSTEPTLLGWVICIMCYQPFLSLFMNMYLRYSSNNWMQWLEGDETLQIIWGSLMLFLLTIYCFASINFGCRFSNLTHRGIITNGLYYFTKHPAYVSKVLFWWMLHIPFIPLVGWDHALRYSLLMIGVSAVYFLRARTEERHLSHDPTYVRYALWVNEHGVLRWCGKLLPFLRYKAPEGWEKQSKTYRGLTGQTFWRKTIAATRP